MPFEDDPQDVVDRTMAELEEYFASQEDENGETQGTEDEPDESSDEHQEELGQGSGQEDRQNEDEGDAGEVTLPDGTVTSLAEIQRLAEFERYLTEHPDVAARVVEAARSTTSPPVVEPVTPPTPPSIPEFIDLEEPSTKWFVDQLTQLQTEHQRVLAEEAQRKIQAANYAAEQALLNVKDRLELSDTEVVRLRDYTASLNIVPGIMSRHQSNQVAGFVEALEIAAYSLPEYREKIIAKQVEAKNKVVKVDNQRKAKLSKLSNRSGGGAPPPTGGKAVKDMTEDERREAMIQQIAEDMGVPR